MKRMLIMLILLACIIPGAVAYGYGCNGISSQNISNASVEPPYLHVFGQCSAYGGGTWGIYATDNATAYQVDMPVYITTIQQPTVFTWPAPANPSRQYYRLCFETYGVCHNFDWWMAEDYVYQPVEANFTASLTEAAGPEYIAFTDTSVGTGINEWNWSYSPTEGVMVSPFDLDNQDIVMLFTQDGNYTITHGVTEGYTSDIETKVDYIWIRNSSDTATIHVRAMDMLSGYGINGAQVNVYDIENTSWTNQTSVTGEVTVSLLTGHTFNAYGSATGYDDGEITGLTAVNGGLYPLYMWPTNLPANVTEGNITVYVTVLEDGTNTRLPGFSVSMLLGGGGPDYTYGVTDLNGVISGVFPNNTNVMISIATQKGYLGATKSINTGTAVGGGDEFVETTIWLQKATVTPTATLTTGPGGTIPVTEDPYPCDADHPENCKRKQADIANILIQYGDMLVLFFIALTIIGGVKMIGK